MSKYPLNQSLQFSINKFNFSEIIESPSNKILLLSPTELNDIRTLKCFKIYKKQGIKHEVNYKIIVGKSPILSTHGIYDEFIKKVVLSCDVVVKNLSTIQLFDGTMTRYLADSRDDNLDLHTEFIQYTHIHHTFKVFLTPEQFSELKEPFLCVSHSLFGSRQMTINVDGIKIHTAKGIFF